MHVCVLNSPVHIAHAHTSIHIHAHLQTHTCIHTQRHTHRCRHRHRYRRRDKNRHRHRHRHRHRRGKGYGREGVDWCLVAHIIFHRYHRTCSMSRHSCHVAMKHVTLKRAYGILRRRATVWVEPCLKTVSLALMSRTHLVPTEPRVRHLMFANVMPAS